MRKIKFRAWDGEKFVYFSPLTLIVDYVEGHDNILGDDLKKLYNLLIENPTNFQPQEYTGLKDKNGVEIYEGDILQHYSAGYHFGVFAVRWDDNGFWDYGLGAKDSEIIGNIYENPELLGGKDGEN